MEKEIRVAHIQGKYGFITAIVTAIIAGIFTVYSSTYIDKLLENIDDLNSQNNLLSKQVTQLELQLNEKESLYSDLQGRYNELENQYTFLDGKQVSQLELQLNETESLYFDLQGRYNELENQYTLLDEKYQKLLAERGKPDSAPVFGTIAKEEKWIDLLDVFYCEGRHKSGKVSGGWHKIWDSSWMKDSLGDEHEHGVYVRAYCDDAYIIEYYLDDIYVGFKGLFTLEYESRFTKIESNMKVYSINENEEKELLYSTPHSLYGGIKPINFDFLTYGADHIRIEISSGSGEKGEFFLALVDTCFYK